MNASEFPQFYEAVHGFPPFPWQISLATQVADQGAWPKCISVPTACGKTSVIDAAVFSLALQADRPAEERIAALRTFFIIDRRIVVDEAAEHAQRLALALRSANGSSPPIVKRVADQLLSFGAREPLQVVALRGGVYRDETWLREPNQPLVCLTTVDQLGSRLLFRGYHLSESQRPIHAGLVANDSLIIVDEAHLSQPFLDTAAQIGKYQTWAERPVSKPLTFVWMSATVRDANTPFSLGPDDYENPVLLKRLNASKVAELHEAEDFEKDAVAHALQLAQEPQVRVVGVVVNRVASARAIFQQLRATECGAVLLTGRIRPYDRDRLLEQYLPKMRAGRDRAKDEPVFVVATQTVEVGANLDFDALVTEASPVDALLQRFGRLDRLGELASTHSVILLRKESRAGKDRIYGEPLQETWTWLKKHARGKKTLAIDFGVQNIHKLLRKDASSKLNTKASAGPLVFPAHIETWVQTNPTPAPDPDVAPFLHGPQALDAADIQVVWRSDLNLDKPDEWLGTVSLAPPTLREALPVSAAAVRSWLAKRAAPDVTDLEGQAGGSAEESRREAIHRPVLIWRGPDHSRVEENPYRIAPGDTIVVPSTYGGADEFGWTPLSTTAVNDVADECINELSGQGRGKYRLRLHADLLFPEAGPVRTAFQESLKALHRADDEGGSPQASFGEILQFIRAHEPNDVLTRLLDRLEALGFAQQFYPSGDACIITARKRFVPEKPVSPPGVNEDATDEDDTSSLVESKIYLSEHTGGVASHARTFAERCGLPDHLVADLLLAASFHDLGKCDPRFQVMLHGGNALAAAAEREPLAKGELPFAVAEYQAARRRAGYPAGARHEFTSVVLASRLRQLESAHDRELVLHLIGAHHGYGRPFPPVCPDPKPVPVVYSQGGEQVQVSSAHGMERLEAGWVDQFWTLVQRYGFWGLAYLESIIRLADWSQSRKEQER